jgi:hypothetical protein
VPRRRELGDYLATVRHQNAFAPAHLAEVFAEPVFELSYTDGFHEPECSVVTLHCQFIQHMLNETLGDQRDILAGLLRALSIGDH